ncbi:MAG: hypothetical protein ACOYXT_06945 [Bacteroidota bacterium]
MVGAQIQNREDGISSNFAQRKANFQGKNNEEHDISPFRAAQTKVQTHLLILNRNGLKMRKNSVFSLKWIATFSAWGSSVPMVF